MFVPPNIFMKRVLTEKKEDYIRAIFYLEEKLGRTAKSIEIAKHLKLGRSTVAERLLDLAKDGYVEHKRYGNVALTKSGVLRARKLTAKHRLIEVFLHTVLNQPTNKVHAEAHRLEHAFSDASIKELSKFLGNPKYDPHGSVIHQSHI